jgi:hypothetical protein
MTVAGEGLQTRAAGQLVDAAAAQGAMPAISADLMVQALDAYRGLQARLDRAMPEQIMELEGRPFRKKGYWRAVALAFNLTVEPVSERREVTGKFQDGRDNFGWVVVYRATHPGTGRSQIGDGACFAVEKARRFRCPHPESEGSRRTLHFPHNTCPLFDPDFSWRALPGEASEHNVRSHAHTRAYNRAVSNLVGFGEVSAEEVQDHDDSQGAPAQARPAGQGRTAAAQEQAATGGAGAPQAPQGAAQPTAALPPGCTYVATVSTKKGKSTRGEWTRYYAKFTDGRDGVTFDTTLGERLQAAAREPKAPVNPELVKGEKGTDLKSLMPIPAAEPVHPADEPVDGPEEVLTVRKIDTDQGPRWVIQTKKRQLVTDVEAHADLAVKARQDKVGIVPTFEVLPARTAGQPPVNRLTGVAVAAPAPAREPGEEG